MKDEIKLQLEESARIKIALIERCSDDLLKAIEIVISAFKNGNKVLICGNGGSAADSQHIAAEFVSSFRSDHMRPSLPAIALTTDSSMITAYSNDFGFEGVFARQIEGLGNKEDVLIALSTSGNSKNVIKAVMAAKQKGLKTIGFLGRSGGVIKDLVDIALVVPSDNTARIQEAHMVMYHILCDRVEQSLY